MDLTTAFQQLAFLTLGTYSKEDLAALAREVSAEVTGKVIVLYIELAALLNKNKTNQENSNMAFVNEYIPEADYEKYDLRRICSEHNLVNRNHMYSRDWTIDRERDAFLIPVWSHHESEFSGYAFYWKGEWMFFEMRPVEGKQDRVNNACWFRFLVKGFVAPLEIEIGHEQLLNDLQAAITASPGGMTYSYSHRSATIEFIEK